MFLGHHLVIMVDVAQNHVEELMVLLVHVLQVTQVQDASKQLEALEEDKDGPGIRLWKCAPILIFLLNLSQGNELTYAKTRKNI